MSSTGSVHDFSFILHVTECTSCMFLVCSAKYDFPSERDGRSRPWTLYLLEMNVERRKCKRRRGILRVLYPNLVGGHLTFKTNIRLVRRRSSLALGLIRTVIRDHMCWFQAYIVLYLLERPVLVV